MTDIQVGQAIERCECHECTQVRWRMSMQGQIWQATHQYPFDIPQVEWDDARKESCARMQSLSQPANQPKDVK